MLQQQMEQLTRESQRRYGQAAGADRKRSKRGLARGDSDGRAKLDLARVTGKDGQAGRLASQLTGRLAHMQERLSALEIKKHHAMSFWLDGSSSPRKQLFTIPAGTLDLDGVRRIIFPYLTFRILLQSAGTCVLKAIQYPLKQEPQGMAGEAPEKHADEYKKIDCHGSYGYYMKTWTGIVTTVIISAIRLFGAKHPAQKTTECEITKNMKECRETREYCLSHPLEMVVFHLPKSPPNVVMPGPDRY